MPHSVSSNDSPKRDGEDEILPDAPPEPASSPSKQALGTNGTDTGKAGVKLEDLFNDDDDDDEFPSSSAVDAKTASSPPAAAL